MNNRNLLALQRLKSYGISPLNSQKHIIAYPYQDDIFPVILSDDGGYAFFECELAICQNGDVIKEGLRYDTLDFDNCLVVKMTLEGIRSRWIIFVDDREFGEAKLSVGEFLNIA
ncbi:MAG: hypothetical protein ACKPCP_37305, partial [Sphaerospermopsis kisseleviana]